MLLMLRRVSIRLRGIHGTGLLECITGKYFKRREIRSKSVFCIDACRVGDSLTGVVFSLCFTNKGVSVHL